MKSKEHIAREIITGNRYLSLATTDKQTPWCSPLAYVVEADYSLIYYSAVNSVHSQNIAQDPFIAAAIFDSHAASDTADGIQLSGIVETVKEPDLKAVMNLYFEKSFPDVAVRIKWLRPVADFMGLAPQRFYRIKPQRMFKLDPNSLKIDRRLEIDLGLLKKLPI